jgi:putative N6-adenine-specific DNA methylase
MRTLGAVDVREVPGGAQCTGPVTLGYALNLWSRVASRVLRRIAHGRYRNEQDVYMLARRVDWGAYFAVERTIRVDLNALHSPLKSLDFATLRVKDAVCDRFRDETGARPSVDTRNPDVRISVFLTADEATFYLDLSGEALFKRGYRGEAGDAPMRENLAAGIVLLTGWRGETPLLDPMCGSGTIVVEAALIALDAAPGLHRTFGFERLRDFDAAAWAALRAEALARRRTRDDLVIVGSDVHPRAVTAARETARAAGVGDLIRFGQGDAAEIAAPAPAGVLICNPPYGVRVADTAALEALYPRLATALKARFAGWRCFFFTADLRMPKLMRLKESRRTPLFNGALECRLFEFRMVAGSNRPRQGDAPA